MTTILKTVSQVLDEAADILTEEGKWTQGDYHVPTSCDTDETGVSHCADGALAFAAGVVSNFRFEDGELRYDWLGDDAESVPIREVYENAYVAAGNYVRSALGHYGGIINYNDTDRRTQAEVVAALRGAADVERARELVAA